LNLGAFLDLLSWAGGISRWSIFAFPIIVFNFDDPRDSEKEVSFV
jgi:hypothetical protein